MKSLSDLEMSLPSTMGQIDDEMPPNPWSNLWPKQKEQSLTHYLVKERTKLQPTAITHRLCALRGVQDGEK